MRGLAHMVTGSDAAGTLGEPFQLPGSITLLSLLPQKDRVAPHPLDKIVRSLQITHLNPYSTCPYFLVICIKLFLNLIYTTITFF